ncbi:MAG: tRNA 2-thiouridine(34) synthase MnmA [Candidatus Sungbacteria bacterium RIFCSPLOWO2_01_FULL_47_32]|nr:MAG: tRNA 2-thiouridine(34) synthase MnmA [Candidatus Sungbacteria bacterium RIFCSPLOWO2_01_FULL_47_32]
MASGGIDSSVAAKLLINAGYYVRMFYIKGWAPEGLECLEPAEKEMAAEVARCLGVDFVPINTWSEHFYDAVFSPMLNGYLGGITPNPDTLCNREIKFRLFADFAFSHGADFIASGHYIRKAERPTRLLVARDPEKDQSYFLYDIGYGVLERSLFPMGEYVKKNDTIRMAREFGFPERILTKRPTVDICFLLKKKSEEGDDPARITMEELLLREGGKRGIVFTPGPIIHVRTGKVVGEHNGVMLYAATIGQRKGIGVHGGKTPMYVAGKDIPTNRLFVSDEQSKSSEVIIHNLNWISGGTPKLPARLSAKIRTPQKLQACLVEETGRDELRVRFDLPQNSVAPGQACVLYDGEVVLGGGIIAASA